ncbi:Rossmann-like and DUF2520 domain-containing protein [Saccharomonospora saliphila]|uniref:Rossmann-like and DUF2520 domain-containing protein n=1 Tax=Saccharomonospora saliphila TaxID=369829 RepID=UPI00039D45A6
MAGKLKVTANTRILDVGAGYGGAARYLAKTAAAGVSDASVRRAERLLPEVPLLPPDDVARGADLVLLALPDDALGPMAQGLAGAGAFRPGQIVVHTSGAHGVEILRPAAEAGALPLALHPVMTFTGAPEDLQRMASCSVGVTAATGDEAAFNVGEALTMEMGGEPVRIPEAARPLYHAALAHGANHLTTLVADCVELLRDSGVGDPERLLGPLLSAALDNVLRTGDRALTGPVARGDAGTVGTHLRVLAEHAPELEQTYATLARRTVARASRAGLLGLADAAEITNLLDDGREIQ